MNRFKSGFWWNITLDAIWILLSTFLIVSTPTGSQFIFITLLLCGISSTCFTLVARTYTNDELLENEAFQRNQKRLTDETRETATRQLEELQETKSLIERSHKLSKEIEELLCK